MDALMTDARICDVGMAAQLVMTRSKLYGWASHVRWIDKWNGWSVEGDQDDGGDGDDADGWNLI